jgi:hypothetical protein
MDTLSVPSRVTGKKVTGSATPPTNFSPAPRTRPSVGRFKPGLGEPWWNCIKGRPDFSGYLRREMTHPELRWPRRSSGMRHSRRISIQCKSHRVNIQCNSTRYQQRIFENHHKQSGSHLADGGLKLPAWR